MNKPESSAVPNKKDSPIITNPDPKPLDVAEQSVKTLVSPEEPTPTVSLQPAETQQSVATAHPIGEIVVEPAPPLKRRPLRTRIRPKNIPVKVHTFDSFHYRDYRLLWGTTLFASGGFWLQQVIIGWLTYQLTQSALLTSIAMGLDTLPILLAGPFGGVLADRWDKRKLLSLVFVYQSVLAMSFGVIVLTGIVEVWHIFAFIFLMGMSWVITDPVRMSLIPNLVPKHSLVNAFALNSMGFSLTRLAIPAVGGMILALAGAGSALLLQGAVILLAVVFALRLRVELPASSSKGFGTVLSEIMEGVRYIRSERVVLGLLLFSLLPAMLIMPFFHGLIPVYAAEVFAVGPKTLGLMMSAIGAGSLTGTVILASFTEIKHKGRIAIGFIGLTSLAMLAFALNPSVVLAFPLLMFGSIGVMGFFSTAQATMQSIMPNEIRGRVSGIYIMAFGTMPLGSLLAGAISQNLGAPTATLIASGTIALIAIGLNYLFKEIWRL